VNRRDVTVTIRAIDFRTSLAGSTVASMCRLVTGHRRCDLLRCSSRIEIRVTGTLRLRAVRTRPCPSRTSGRLARAGHLGPGPAGGRGVPQSQCALAQ
jgi:hypothetical protein